MDDLSNPRERAEGQCHGTGSTAPKMRCAESPTCGQVVGILNFCALPVGHDGDCTEGPAMFGQGRPVGVRLDEEFVERIKNGPADPGEGEHLWVMAIASLVPDLQVKQLVRGEDPGDLVVGGDSVVSLQGPGCYKCEQPFSTHVYFRVCKGSMDPI